MTNTSPTIVQPRLDGRNIVLTGASRGLGEAIAALLWRLGASVALVARSEPALDQLRGRLGAAATGAGAQECLLIPADLGVPGAPESIASALGWSRVDGLVNNAGMIGPIGGLEENDWTAWEQTMRVNLLAPVALCRALLGRMGEGSAIVNLSGGGATSPRPRFGAYATSKAGLVRFTENLAVELAGRGIRANAVAPGAMNTAMLEAVLAAGGKAAGAEFGKAIEQKQQGGVAPDKAAELIAWLLSPASEGISGRLISAVWDPWPRLGEHAAALSGKSDIYTLRRITPEDRGQKWE